jgi:hypothetical protein
LVDPDTKKYTSDPTVDALYAKPLVPASETEAVVISDPPASLKDPVVTVPPPPVEAIVTAPFEPVVIVTFDPAIR